MPKHFIGIGLNYTGTYYALPDCELDIQRFAKLADGSKKYSTVKQFFALQYNDLVLHIKSLNLKRGDVLLFMYSGHGTQIYSQNSIEPDKNDEAFVFWDGETSTYVYDDTIKNLLTSLPSTVICIFDSCHSGGMERATLQEGRLPKYIPYNLAFEIEQRATPPKNLVDNRVMLFACQENQLASSTGNGGEFANALLRSMKEGAKTVNTVFKNCIKYTDVQIPVLYNKTRRHLI